MQENADYRAGMICACVYNAAPSDKKRSKPYEPLDFFPHLKHPASQNEERIEPNWDGLFAFLDRQYRHQQRIEEQQLLTEE